MITHLFYHQESVEEQCAINSWMSIRNNIKAEDEVIILDLGGTLTKLLPITVKPKFLRYEIIRTDLAEEKSYTFGLNLIIPSAKNEWICLWRSDYIYNKRYFPAVQQGMREGNAVLPYEAFIGGEYCTANWCKKKLSWLINSDEKLLIKHSHVCPIYEITDFAHFALKKNLWIKLNGMNEKLWGYGWQFPEFFARLKSEKDYHPSIQFDMIAFHQNHLGSFGLGKLNQSKKQELEQAELKLIEALGSIEAVEKFKKDIIQQPLRSRYDEKCYKVKPNKMDSLKSFVKTKFNYLLKNHEAI